MNLSFRYIIQRERERERGVWSGSQLFTNSLAISDCIRRLFRTYFKLLFFREKKIDIADDSHEMPVLYFYKYIYLYLFFKHIQL